MVGTSIDHANLKRWLSSAAASFTGLLHSRTALSSSGTLYTINGTWSVYQIARQNQGRSTVEPASSSF